MAASIPASLLAFSSRGCRARAASPRALDLVHPRICVPPQIAERTIAGPAASTMLCIATTSCGCRPRSPRPPRCVVAKAAQCGSVCIPRARATPLSMPAWVPMSPSLVSRYLAPRESLPGAESPGLRAPWPAAASRPERVYAPAIRSSCAFPPFRHMSRDILRGADPSRVLSSRPGRA